MAFGELSPQMVKLLSADARANDPNELARTWANIREAKQKDQVAADKKNLLNAVSAPKTDKSPQKQALQRWGDQIEAMMMSGNPQLQKQAMSMMNNYQQKATSVPTDGRTTAFKNYEHGVKNPAFAQYQKDNAIQRTQNVFDPNTPMPLALAKSLKDPVTGQPINPPIGATYKWAQDKGLVQSGTSQSAEEREKVAQYDLATRHSDQLLQLIDNGEIEAGGMQGFLTKFRAGGDIANVAANELLNMSGNRLKITDAKALNLSSSLSTTMGKILSGADVPESQYQRLERELPTYGQPDELFLINTLKTIENLKHLKEFKQRQTAGTGDTYWKENDAYQEYLKDDVPPGATHMSKEEWSN